jgi:hypothetical protein
MTAVWILDGSDRIDVNEGLGTHVDRGDVNLGLAAAMKGL